MPERVARFNDHFPNDLLYEDFVNGKKYEGEGGNGGPGGEWASMSFKYDDGGNRIFEKSATRGAFEYGRLTVPGVGMFEQERYTAYELKRLDLVGGGFRLGLNGEALFPLTDAQGNIRGYVSRSGWRGLHAYYPFGSSVDFVNQQGEDKRRWQSKEFDGEHGKLYFGARFYDPFLGLWMSPDPAGQFMNSYSYGGDPLNYIDPTGLWSLGIGFVFGWDSERGWHMGFGVAADLTNGKGDGFGFNLSYTWHDDGSSSFNIGSNASFWIYFVNINFGLSYSYNTYSGSVLSTSGGVCFGKKGVACAGVESGGSLYWDRSGSFMGATAYTEAYAEVAGGFMRVSGGYELGLFGMEGRGLYAGGTVAGLHGEVSQRDGGNWGFDGSVYYGIGDKHGEKSLNDGAQNNVHREIWIPSLGQYGHFKIGGTYDVSHQGMSKAHIDAMEAEAKQIKDEAVRKKALDLISKKGTNMTLDEIRTLASYLGRSARVLPWYMDWSCKYDKIVIDGTSGGYPQIEFKYVQDGSNGSTKAFSSYNYGSNVASHLLIDFAGYYLSRFVYNVK